MTNLDEFQVLVSAVGEYTVSALGSENLDELRVTIMPTDLTCHISIVLQENSDDAQRAAIASMLEVEQIYFDELVISFSFLSSLEDEDAPRASVPQYDFA